MSYEGGVMPSDEMRDITPQEGNTYLWAKGLSALDGHLSGTAQDFEPENLVTAVMCRVDG